MKSPDSTNCKWTDRLRNWSQKCNPGITNAGYNNPVMRSGVTCCRIHTSHSFQTRCAYIPQLGYSHKLSAHVISSFTTIMTDWLRIQFTTRNRLIQCQFDGHKNRTRTPPVTCYSRNNSHLNLSVLITVINIFNRAKKLGQKDSLLACVYAGKNGKMGHLTARIITKQIQDIIKRCTYSRWKMRSATSLSILSVSGLLSS